MTSRELSINTSLVNPTSLNGGLPSPTPSENSLMTATTTTTPLSSHTSTFLDIPSSFASFSFGQRPHVSGTLIRQRSFSGTDDDEAAALYAAVSRRPSLPVTSNSIHHHPMERHPSYDPRRQPGYIGHHPFLQQQQQEYERTMQRPLTPITPSSTPSPGSLPFANNTSSVQDNTTTTTNVIGSDIRHPLWKLECRVCTKVLCEQAMQGHLLGDPSQRLFSTNLAIGVQASSGQPVSDCQCKFQYFACAECETECGYSLTETCADCQAHKDNNNNGHFWVFYAHKVNPHWRTIQMKDCLPSFSSHHHNISNMSNNACRNMFWDDLPTWHHDRQLSNVGR